MLLKCLKNNKIDSNNSFCCLIKPFHIITGNQAEKRDEPVCYHAIIKHHPIRLAHAEIRPITIKQVTCRI